MLQTAAELTSPVGKEKEGELPEAKGELETTQDEYITSKEDSFVVCVGAFVSLQKSSYAVSLSWRMIEFFMCSIVAKDGGNLAWRKQAPL